MKIKIEDLNLDERQKQILKICLEPRDAYYISSRLSINYVTLNHNLNSLVSLDYLKLTKKGRRNVYGLNLQKIEV